MNTDHIVGGGVATIVGTNLPTVLAYFQGPAPVNQETALILVVGAFVVTAVRWWWLRRQAAKTVSVAPAQ